MPRQLIACLSACALLLAPAGRAAEQDGERMLAERFEVGHVGYFRADPKSTVYFHIRILEIIDKDTMLMKLGRMNPAFLLKGMPTKGLVEDKVIEVKGKWKVTDTKKHRGKTYYLVEPVKEEKK